MQAILCAIGLLFIGLHSSVAPSISPSLLSLRQGGMRGWMKLPTGIDTVPGMKVVREEHRSSVIQAPVADALTSTEKIGISLPGPKPNATPEIAMGGSSRSFQGSRDGLWSGRKHYVWCSDLSSKLTYMDPPTTRLPSTTTLARAAVYTGIHTACDMLGVGGCDAISSGSGEAPDRWIVEFIETAMAGCGGPSPRNPPCLALDIGSNLGLVSTRLMQAGAEVTAFEPQIDLCCASNASAGFNKLSAKLQQHCGAVSPSEEVAGSSGDAGFESSPKWRYGAEGAQINAPITTPFKQLYESLGIPSRVPMFTLGDVIVPGTAYDFIKIDTDSVDCQILQSLIGMQRRGVMSFRSASLETWHPSCNSDVLRRLLIDLQSDDYTIFLARPEYGNKPPPPEASLPQDFPTLRAGNRKLITTTLVELKNLTKAEWEAAPDSRRMKWRKRWQMLATKALPNRK